MATLKCKKCGTELTQTEGRRAKEFCNSNCRSTFWQKNKKKINDLSEVSSVKHIPASKREICAAVAEQVHEEKSEPQLDIEEIKNQIKAIREEKIPKERDTILGRKVWSAEQEKKISDLQKLLNPKK